MVKENWKLKDSRHQEYLTELKRHEWRIVDKANNRNCIHPAEENLTCGEYREGVTELIPQGKINYPEGYAKDRDFWICPKHLSFYQIDKN